MQKVSQIQFPEFSGIRCLMLPYIQGDPESVPLMFRTGYEKILEENFIDKGDIGYLTIDEKFVLEGTPHRGKYAKHGRALHTEGGAQVKPSLHAWGRQRWGGSIRTTLDPDTKLLIANSIDDTCAVWDTIHQDTSLDGDIGHLSHLYPYEDAVFMKQGELFEIGILVPHESIPLKTSSNRQFLRIISNGIQGSEDYFTPNPLIKRN